MRIANYSVIVNLVKVLNLKTISVRKEIKFNPNFRNHRERSTQ